MDQCDPYEIQPASTAKHISVEPLIFCKINDAIETQSQDVEHKFMTKYTERMMGRRSQIFSEPILNVQPKVFAILPLKNAVRGTCVKPREEVAFIWSCDEMYVERYPKRIEVVLVTSIEGERERQYHHPPNRIGSAPST